MILFFFYLDFYTSNKILLFFLIFLMKQKIKFILKYKLQLVFISQMILRDKYWNLNIVWFIHIFSTFCIQYFSKFLWFFSFYYIVYKHIILLMTQKIFNIKVCLCITESQTVLCCFVWSVRIWTVLEHLQQS